MAAIQITKKTTKDEAAKLLAHNADALTAHGDTSLNDRVRYALSHYKEATRTDMVSALREVMKALGDKFVIPAAADEADTNPDADDGATPPKKEPKTDGGDKKKSGGKPKSETLVKKTKKGKKVESESVLETVNPSENPKVVLLAKMFPEKITVGGLEFNVHHGVTLKTLADDTLDFTFAFYWTKRHLRQFPYFSDLLGHPKSFPNDLDTAQLIYVDDGDENGDNRRVAYAVSDSTGAVYTILPDFLEEIDGMCCGAGIEFQVYSRPVTEQPTEDDDSSEEEENA